MCAANTAYMISNDISRLPAMMAGIAGDSSVGRIYKN